MQFSSKEKQHILRAWAAITLAFAILNSGLSWSAAFLIALLIAGVTVGSAFVLHELAHKYFAQKYGCRSEFRAFDNMLVLAVLMSFFGFIIAAPGAVFIHGNVNKARHGRIAFAGPATNVVLAVVFFTVFLAVPQGIASQVAFAGMTINGWLATFNLIPLGIFDGAKVLAWNKKAYGLLVAAAFATLLLPILLAVQ